MNKNYNIAGRITKVKYNEDDLSQITAFLNEIQADESRQNDFFDYCKNTKIAAWVYIRIKDCHFVDYLNAEVVSLFEKEFQKILLQNEQRNDAVIPILKSFVENDIDVIVLKGNVFTQTIYKSFGYKRMNDFDILIKKEDWSKIQDIYQKLNFIPLGFGWTGEKHQATNFSHTGIPYISRNLKCMIGSQWGLKAPTSSYKFNINEIWETAEDYDFKGIKVKKLSAKNNLLHLVLHLGIYKCGVRDCMDIYNLLLTENIEKYNFAKIFIDANGLVKAFFAFNLCHKMASIPDSETLNLVDNTKPSLLKKIYHKRIKAIDESQNWQVSYNDYFQDIEKNVVYFNIYHEFHVKLKIYVRIIQQIFFPKSEMALKFIEKSHQPTILNKIKAFFIAPFYVLALLSEEIGLQATLYILVKLFFNLIESISNYFIPQQNYFDYLEKQNIDPKTVKNLVNNVQ
ncbi:MAG: nucleotidyltransferase family protein [Flavobacterium sp.]|nr:nucleotidyltransferase family protein [Flavobacterium sp.]